ncbi:MAG: hypothetical protein V1773_19615 [bacterium]
MSNFNNINNCINKIVDIYDTGFPNSNVTVVKMPRRWSNA